MTNEKKTHILFMCVANSARSQLAEGLARHLYGEKAVIKSAGSNPSKLNPFAVQVMKEMNVDISRHYSKTVDDLDPIFILNLDYIITLCAEEVCPTMSSRSAQKLHWPLPDPAVKPGTEISDDELTSRFRKARESVQEKLITFGKERGLL